MPINLPNGANVEEIVLPNGSNAERVIGPDGSTLWERNAIPDKTVLQPESDDLTHFGGDTANFEVNTNSPTLDTRSLKYQADGGNYAIGSTSGLSNYPTVDEMSSVFINLNAAGSNEDPRPQILFNNDSGTGVGSGYGFLVDGQDDLLRIQRWDSGSETTIADPSVSLPGDSWIVLEWIHESDGTLTTDIYQSSDTANYRDGDVLLNSHEVTDDTHITSGSYDAKGIGFRVFNETASVVESWRTD